MSTHSIREVEADYGRRIRIYDDVFQLIHRGLMYDCAQKSFFRLGWEDSLDIDRRCYPALHSLYSDEDVKTIGVLDYLSQTPLAHELVGYRVTKCVLNLSTPSDPNFVHAHCEDKALLVYLNTEWKDGWHGETLFYSDNMRDIVFASPYTPNRVIVFDPKMPHTIRPQSSIAPFHRFTLGLFLTADSPPLSTDT